MMEEEFAKLSKPIFATEREADLFALANHYRGIVEGLLRRAAHHRVLYSNMLTRELSLEMMKAFRPELLSFQLRPIETAPRDERKIVVIDGQCRLNVASYREGDWRMLVAHIDYTRPVAWVPIDMAAMEDFCR